MLIAIDGASKRNGQVTCTSTGAAFITTDDGDSLFLFRAESCSTNQRGEINGLLCALQYAVEHVAVDEDVIIITDSEYIYNTISKDWLHKWANNHWIGSAGAVKNADQWQAILPLVDKINKVDKEKGVEEEHLFMQWIKGHLMTYTDRNTHNAMVADDTGIELYARINTMARRPSEMDRIINDVVYNLEKHEKIVPPRPVCLEWAIVNTVADCLASYLVDKYDDVLL